MFIFSMLKIMMEAVFVVVLALQLLVIHGQAQSRQQCGSEIRISSSSQVVTLGSNATITCQHTNPSANVAFLWYFLPATLSNSEPSRLLVHDGVHFHISRQLNKITLLITNVTLGDIGRYMCEKVNPPSCFTSRSDVTLFEKARITISAVPYRMYIRETINITTMVTGNPLPTTITVEKQDPLTGLYVDYPNTKYSVIDLSTISFTALSLEDNGQYRACVENSHAAIGCAVFTTVVQGLILIPPMATVKNGSSLSVTCRVVNQFDDFEMTWQATGTGDDLANDPSVRVTQLNTSDLHLFVERITKSAEYSCVLQSSRTIIAEYITVYVIDIPGPPRNLNIQETGSDGGMYITWTGPETDNGSPLTAYYVNITVNGVNSTIVRVVPGKTELDYVAGKCRVINVTVTSENACGNSSAVEFSIDTRNQCAASSVGNSQSGDDDDDDDMLRAIGAGVSTVVAIFVGLTILAALIFAIFYRRQKRDMKHSSTLHDLESSSNVTIESHEPVVTSSAPPYIKKNVSIYLYRNMLEVSKDSVTLQDFLHEGTYFELQKGLLVFSENKKAAEVMIKKAKQFAPSEEEHNIQEEIKMMSTVGIHENVVGLLRTCLSEPPAYLITEYFAHGDLLGFLRASRGHYGMYTVSPGTGCKTRPCAVQGQDLLRMMRQIAAGMSYLAERKVTHRSLCARNVLVGTGLKVKVYNYGPKADNEDTPPNYDKWMAPEMLFDGTANTMSDVWSFAVTSWEIITIGGSPYPHTHPEQMRDLLWTGYRLHKPDHCDEALYIIMDQCWNMDPNNRPTFVEVHKHLNEMCESKLSYLNLDLYNDEEYSQFEETQQLMTAL